MGLSEKTDALVIIVSEETGRVMVAKNGEISEIKDNLALQGALREHSGITADDRGGRHIPYVPRGRERIIVDRRLAPS